MRITDRAELRRAIDGYRLARCIQVAAELGIADLLAEGPLAAAELADEIQADRDALARLLRALVASGVFVRNADGRFALDGPARFLRSDCEGSLRASAVIAGRQHYPTWHHLLYSVRTGAVAFDDLHGTDVWTYRRLDGTAGRDFDAAMVAQPGSGARAVVDAFDFSRFARVADVGGGRGTLLATILRSCPEVRGVLFERPEILPGARDHLARAGVLDRCELVAGDFLRSVEVSCELVILQRILHDWDDPRARGILAACRASLPAGRTLLVIERVLPDDDPPPEAALTDLTMLVMNGGRERTGAELRALLAAEGFAVGAILPTETPLRIVVAQAVRG